MSANNKTKATSPTVIFETVSRLHRMGVRRRPAQRPGTRTHRKEGL